MASPKKSKQKKPRTRFRCIHCKKLQHQDVYSFSRRGAECDECLDPCDC